MANDFWWCRLKNCKIPAVQTACERRRVKSSVVCKECPHYPWTRRPKRYALDEPKERAKQSDKKALRRREGASRGQKTQISASPKVSLWLFDFCADSDRPEVRHAAV